MKSSADFFTLFSIDSIIDGKYKIISPPYAGGMSAVFCADQKNQNRRVAIKAPLPSSERDRAILSFERESRALNDLFHKNIVSAHDQGVENGIPFLVLEWLPGGDLSRFILESKGRTWADFYDLVGRQILQGIIHAHKREWAHRDLKPQNILFDVDGVPKITDFGISRNTAVPQIGHTFHQSGSPPYTPPEMDDGYRSDIRDIYSWCAIAVCSLAAKLPSSRAELLQMLESIRDTTVPLGLLRAGLSESPADRPEAATVFLADLDTHYSVGMANVRNAISVHLKITSQNISQLRSSYPSLDEVSCFSYIESDVNSGWAAYVDHAEGVVQIFGATIRLRCRIRESVLEVEQVSELPADRAAEFREFYQTVPGVTFTQSSPRDTRVSATAVRALISRLDVIDSAQAAAEERKRQSYWFDCWSDFLRDKERIYKYKQKKFSARRIEVSGENLVATIDGDFRIEDIGPSLVAHTPSGKPLIFIVNQVSADQIRLTLRSGKLSEVPRENVSFQSNFEAERKSLLRQRTALEDIRGGSAVNPRIGAVLSDPVVARPPEPAGLDFESDLSVDKLQVLDKAMEVQDVLVVNGPPGTGKTTLIAELIETYLKRYPTRRILLSSQTHVALDHIIVKLDEKNLSSDVVRIVSSGLENASKINKDVEHLTLEKKVREWCIKAESRSEKFMEELAANREVNAFEVKLELLGRTFLETRKILNKLYARLKEIESEKRGVDEDIKKSVDEGEQLNSDEIVQKTEYILHEEDALRQQIASLEARITRISLGLQKLDGFEEVFRESDDRDLEIFLDALIISSPSRDAFLPLVQLHLDWLTRLGSERSFHGAVLGEARIVAGTCIGLASTPAFQNDSFDLCIIDEASKATATEAIVPMSRSSRTILVGDPKQLPPFIEDRDEDGNDNGLSEDSKKSLLSVLLEKLPESNIEELVEQRRMCWTIGELVSQVFYDRKLNNVRADDLREKVIAGIYPFAVNWCSTSKLKQRRETETSGKSFENGTEVQRVIEHLKEISRGTRKSKKVIKIAVIAAYSAQVALLRDRIAQQVAFHANAELEVNTVDAFQGREADICIYSITRSNDENIIGFQREKERLNVALSRARDALIIIGDADFCNKAGGRNPFKAVIEYIKINSDFCSLNYYE